MYILKKDGNFIFRSTSANGKGFITPLATDAHLHFIALGEKLNSIDLEFKSLSEIKEAILLKLKEKPSKLIMRGWAEPDAEPTKKFLDEINSEIPIMLVRRCGHIAVINSKTFEELNFEGFEKYIKFDTGRIVESSIHLFYEKFGVYTDIQKNFEKVENYMLNLGYGFVHSDDLHGIKPENLPYENTKIKVFEKVAIENYEDLVFKFSNGYFKNFNSVKMFLDGSFGGRTAYLKEKYSDADTKGELLWSEENLEKVLRFCEKNKFHLAMHAIGDGALDVILNVFEKVKPILTHRVIHAALIQNYQLDIIQKHKLILDMQPTFIKSDIHILNKRLGDREKYSYRFKEISDRKIPYFISSDAPIERVCWWEYPEILAGHGISYKESLMKLFYAPEEIDGFSREASMEEYHLQYKNNPFENYEYPEKIFIKGNEKNFQSK